MLNWLPQPTSRQPIRVDRIRNRALPILLTRLIEGGASWVILELFYSQVTVSPWAIRLTFTLYALANCLLFIEQRRRAVTRTIVWIDIVVNMLPMAAGAHWSGGIYSPLLAVFVLKIGNYGLTYSVETGVQSLLTTGVIAAGLWGFDLAGWSNVDNIEQVPPLVRQQLTLAFGGLLFVVGCIGALLFFRELADREMRLGRALQEQEKLYQQSLKDQEHLRELSRGLVHMSESTMQQVSHELHDDLGQALTAIKMDLGRIDRELPPGSPLAEQLREARDQIGQALQRVRNLSQLLRPAVLDDLGLAAAMKSYTSRFSEQTGIVVNLDVPPFESRLPQNIEVALYRVMQEALTNVSRHATAKTVDIRLTIQPESASLQVCDDGCGFDAKAYLTSHEPKRGVGITGMRERAEIYGGQLQIWSHIGGGTQVYLSIPRYGQVNQRGASLAGNENQRAVG